MERFKALTVIFCYFSCTLFKNSLSSSLGEFIPDPDCTCDWSSWMNNIDYNAHINDNNTYVNLREHHDFCETPSDIECRSKRNPETDFIFFRDEGLDCNVTSGLLCESQIYPEEKYIRPYFCDDFEIKVLCCDCPHESTLSPLLTTTTGISNLKVDDLFIDTTSAEVTSSDPGMTFFGMPISLLIVIAVAVLLIVGISLCVIFTQRDRNKPKVIRRNLRGDSYLQRPVSFTDVDLMKRSSVSSCSSSPNIDQYSEVPLTQLESARLQFADPEPEDEPDVVTSTKYPSHEPMLRQSGSENRWLPDEFGRQLEQQIAKNAKKSAFSHPAPSPPPPPPVQKSVMFPDSNE